MKSIVRTLPAAPSFLWKPFAHHSCWVNSREDPRPSISECTYCSGAMDVKPATLSLLTSRYNRELFITPDLANECSSRSQHCCNSPVSSINLSYFSGFLPYFKSLLALQTSPMLVALVFEAYIIFGDGPPAPELSASVSHDTAFRRQTRQAVLICRVSVFTNSDRIPIKRIF